MLDRNSYIPAYMQVKQYYLKKIQNHELAPGERLPTEQEISEIWGLSKMTVRQGLQQLVKEGYVRARRGIGIFVANTPMLFDTIQFTSFSARKKDRSVKTEVLVFEKRGISPEDSLKYFKQIYDYIWYCERLRHLDGQPAQYEISYMPYNLFPKINKKEMEKSKYHYVNTTQNWSISASDRIFSAEITNKTISKLLNVKEGTGVIKVESTGFLSNDIIFERVVLFHHPDLCMIKGRSPYIPTL